jgi:HEAT repeat protein
MHLASLLFLLFVSCGSPPKDRARSILSEGIKDESGIIRVNAAKGLAEIGDQRGYEVLYAILKDKDSDAVVAALGALLELGEEECSPVIVQLCRDKDPLIRAEAYRLIGQIQDTACRQLLIDGTRDRISKVRRISYAGLAAYMNEEIIYRGLKDVDPLVRIASAKALAMMGEKQAVNIIKRELDPRNPNVEIWAQACLALAEVADTASRGFIASLLVDTPWDLKVAAAEALIIMRDGSGLDVLEKGLKSPDPFVRVKCVEVLKKYPQSNFYAVLAKAAEDDYINVSVGAIEALKKLGKKESLKLFEKLMSAPNPLVKLAAATAYLKVSM